MPKYDVVVRPRDSNAFMVMGAVIGALREAGATKEEIKEYQAKATSGDYNNLLQVSMDWVDLQPTNGFEEEEEDDN